MTMLQLISISILIATRTVFAVAPFCDGVLEHRDVDFEIDARGRPLMSGQTPFELPNRVRVIGKRFGLNSKGQRDTIILDADKDKRFEERNFGDISSANDQGNHGLALALKGNSTQIFGSKRNIGFITFRFLKTVHQIRYLRFVGRAHGSVAAFGPEVNGSRLHKKELNGFSFLPREWYGIGKIRINLRSPQAVARVGITACNRNRRRKECSKGQLLLQDGRCTSNVWQPHASVPALLQANRADLALSSDGFTLVTGDSEKADSTFRENGEVKVFSWDGISWSQKGQTLFGRSVESTFLDFPVSGNFGASVDASRYGKIILVAARAFQGISYAQAYKFNREKQLWETLGNEIRESEVAMSEDGQFLVGGRKEGNGFRAYLLSGNTWKQVGTEILQGDEPGFERNFGEKLHVSADGSTFAVGFSESGAAFGCGGRVSVYRRVKDSNASNGYDLKQLGPTIFADMEFDQFGSEVAMSKDGSILAVEDRTDVHVYKYSKSADDWLRLGDVFANFTSGDFGGGIALSDDGLTLAIGFGFYDDSRGTVIVFRFDEIGGKWDQLGQRLEGDVSAIDIGVDFEGSKLGFDKISLSGDGNVVAAFSSIYRGFNDESTEVKVWSLVPTK